MKPEIRFNGFSDEWVEKKLGQILKVPEKVEVTVTNNEQLLTVKLHGGGVHEMPSNKLLKLGSTKYYVRKGGQLIYGKQNFFNGSIAIIPLELDGKASSGDVPSFDIVNADPVYLYQKISQPEFYKRTEDWASGTGSKRLHEKTIQQFKIQLPSLPEQQKIGALFSKYDTIIGLREQKLEELNALKQGLLQQMFPKTGAKVPELRFKGFADEWVERKLGDHAKYRRGSFPQPYGNKEWYDGESAMPFVQVVDVTNELTLVENTKQKISKLAQSKSVFVPKGKVVVTLQGSIGRVAITQYDSFVDRTLLIFEDYEKETDERFWAYTIQKKFEIEKLKAPGGTIKTITKEALSSFDVHLPKFDEQQKIGQLFKQLDARILDEQSKIEQLKLQKQGLLQRML